MKKLKTITSIDKIVLTRIQKKNIRTFLSENNNY